MLDFIFCNPATNPMSEETKKADDSNSTVPNISPSESISKELHDKPTKNETETRDQCEEDSIPVPQIKVGPDEEIIIDEDSLVIENQGTKIGRQSTQNSETVDGDLEDNIGFKNSKISKEWIESETTRFYHALNTIGTDFKLMCKLFPLRTCEELRDKYENEKSLNRQLVDSAMVQPKQYDMDDLFKELVDELEEVKEKTTKNIRYTDKRAICIPKEENEDHKKLNPRKRASYEYVKGAIISVLSDSEDDCTEKNFHHPYDYEDSSDEDSEDEVVSMANKPTRSGRMPKPRQIPIEFIFSEEPKKRRVSLKKLGRPPKTVKKEPDEPIEPGSLMIISSTDHAGDLVYKLYMVTPGKGKTEISFSEDIIGSFAKTAFHQQTQFMELPFPVESILTISEQVEKKPVIENNITIAEDGGDSLRPSNDS